MSMLTRLFPALVGIATLLIGQIGSPVAGTPAASPANEVTTYQAVLSPLNSDVNGGDATGLVTLTMSGDELTIRVAVNGVAPGIEHLQHFHGFADSDQAATCPGMDADENGDGVVDLIETEPMAGTTMVPFTENPASLEIVEAKYPMADENGSYTYEQTVVLSELESSFSEKFDGQELNLDKRVVFVHTVANDTELPDSAQSLDDIPAQVTLPVACGELSQVDGATPMASPES